jgi:hypothetical protein
MKNFALLILGLGLIPLAGCMSSATDEDIAHEEAMVTNCSTVAGMFPTKAGLAVAMAEELGRFDPVHDLTTVATYTPTFQRTTVLSSTAKCLKNKCANTKALLGQQTPSLSAIVDQSIFNPTNYSSDLKSSFDRQTDLIANLTKNNPKQLPPAHKLTKVAGPLNLGRGACGAHYVFQADHLDGTPLTSSEAENMSNSLMYFGYGLSGGNNPYIAFAVTSQGCPKGRTCIAIDPTDGDNGSTATTTGQAAVTYPMNRVWDPANDLLGDACVTTANKRATLVSKCATLSSTCGFLYCVAP